MTFAVISNEHSPVPLGQPPWLSAINRIRLVDANDGDGDPVDTDDDGYFEIRCAHDLQIKDRDGETDPPYGREMEDGDLVYISGTQSTPTLNGYWHITGVNLGDRTFILKAPLNNDYGEETVVMDNANNANAGGDATQLKWNEEFFTAANDGHVSWGSADNAGISSEVKS